ncbi:hypothetical protein, variant [Aphanomyces invadans]|uniref:RING-type domain-containing protein n=1 Tax=Aphanomyces invadans TaxID=157072 RepID=A0A024TAI0_9STRA|nr:hypothetical protein, variant [Aphanomyces invadans]ETV90994.1 hypothetical protein, variant [Aphanomyces invadans]|eukprot:XP_008880383.1 hypothetical protein, variant [Aphanomyces invadans]
MCSIATSTAILAPPPRARPLSSPLGVPTTTQLNHEEDDVVVVTKKRRTSSGSRWDPAAHKDTMVELRKQGVRDAVATAHQAFRCPICLDTYGDMVVECAECAHVFCDPCMRESLKRKDKCPLCRCNPMPLRRCKPIERLVAALPEACAFLDNGCFDVTLTRATAFRHSLSCGFARFTCPHCRNVFLRHDHDEAVCASELHACPLAALGCSFRGRTVDMDGHVKDRVHFDLARRVLKGGASEIVPTR